MGKSKGKSVVNAAGLLPKKMPSGLAVMSVRAPVVCGRRMALEERGREGGGERGEGRGPMKKPATTQAHAAPGGDVMCARLCIGGGEGYG